MGLSSALLTAVSGLQASQAGVDLVARNVANADTPGYTRKSIQQESILANGQSIGVRATAITRALDSLTYLQLRNELGARSRINVIADALTRLDSMYGVPGGAGALDTAVNDLVSSLQSLTDSPESLSSRAGVLAQAEALVANINNLANGIQGLRQNAENGISDAVARANGLIDQIAEYNGQIAEADTQANLSSADLLDRRDALLSELASLIDIQVQESGSGSVRVFTGNGHLLVDDIRSSNLLFDANTGINAQSFYDRDPGLRGVGTLLLDNGNGQFIDLFRDGAGIGGMIGGYRELRDDILVTAQGQLDELAHALASAFSDRAIDGSAVSVGPQDGFDVDLAALLPGDEVSITYVATPPGETRTVTVVRVDDPSVLPLANDATADPNDTVIGIDFSGGIGAAATALDAALGANFTVSNPSGSTLRILGDGAAGTIDITGVTAHVTATGTADEGLGLPLFVDGPGGTPYTGALDGNGQKLGFASRIAVNPAVKANDQSLVVYSTSPPTSLGDQSRPLELLARLTETPFTFAPVGGLGSSSAPLRTTIDDYARDVVSTQTGRSASVQSQRAAQEALTRTLEERVEQKSGVDVDAELSRLVVLQTTYAANARIISVVQDLLTLLTRI